jgi:HD-GYP domain-containing protein (c-di-GMP phosphodiesterase class II)
MPAMKISLSRAITALTSVLDFVGVDEVQHGKRVALMASAVAEEMGWSGERCRQMLYAGMLHDCGVSRLREHRLLTDTLEWDGAEEHCLRGEEYLLACPPLAHLAPVVRWHHTRWERLPGHALTEAVREEANLIFLADRADVLLAPYANGGALRNEILWEHPQITDRLATLAGTLFSPALVDGFRRAAASEGFWLSMDPAYLVDEINEHLDADTPIELDTAEALAVAGLFARAVDAKSPYTQEHSTRVAAITRLLAECDGLQGEALYQIEIAALLHDIGKLRVPEEIIDKPAAITVEERALVKRHSYDTGQILKKVFPGQPIADWAAMHHENLLGTGYPDQIPAARIPREARLIAVADIFQALAQNRPYRGRLKADAILEQLRALAAAGHIDAELVELAARNLDHCYELATA